jgi:hypothetical protein
LFLKLMGAAVVAGCASTEDGADSADEHLEEGEERATPAIPQAR